MKIGPAAADRFLAKPPEAVRVYLLYGPDGGLVRERARGLARRRVEDLDDPFRVSVIAPAALKDEPGLLADEAAALSLTGEARVVRIAGAGDTCTEAFEILLSRPEAVSLVVAEAGELPTRSRLRKLIEDAPDAAAVGCYPDDEATIGRLIADALEEAGIAIAPDALTYLADHLGADREVTRSEIDKLVLYARDTQSVSLEDAAFCCGDSAILTLDDLCDAVATGDVAGVLRCLDRLLEEGVSPITVLRAAQRHLQRIHLTASLIAAGRPPEDAVKALRPPVFFKRAEPFRKALRRWSAGRAATALDRLNEAEALCKSGNAPPAPVCGAALISLARAAAGT